MRTTVNPRRWISTRPIGCRSSRACCSITDVADDAVRHGSHRRAAHGRSHRPRPRIRRTLRGRPAVDLPSLARERALGRGAHRAAERRVRSADPRLRARAGCRGCGRVARANALAADLAAARAALEAEQRRSRELERTLAERSSAADSARSRAEEALRDSERHQSEARTLRESLAARDATIVQVLHSLGERDAQLSALQREHAKIVPALEATSKSSDAAGGGFAGSARAEPHALAAELEGQPASRWRALSAQAERSEVGNQCRAIRFGSREDRRRAPIWNCCGLAIGAAASIRICSASWTRRSARRTRAASALEAERDRLQASWPLWKRSSPRRRDDRQAAGAPRPRPRAREGQSCGDRAARAELTARVAALERSDRASARARAARSREQGAPNAQRKRSVSAGRARGADRAAAAAEQAAQIAQLASRGGDARAGNDAC